MITLKALTDVGKLLFPDICQGCGNEINNSSHLLCYLCIKELPITGFEKSTINPTATLFSGRIAVEKASSWLFFGKDGLSQHLIHQLKYRKNTAIGDYLGEQMGLHLQKSGWFDGIDIMVPLPLNRKKLAKRGYNQATVLCQGIQKSVGLPIEEVAVIRTIYTQTQTKKTRIERWRNVADVFDINVSSHLHNKHILLVDDVITTGATIEACGQVLINIPGVKLSVLSLAIASKL